MTYKLFGKVRIFQTCFGKFISARTNGAVVANVQEARGFEKFEVLETTNGFIFKTYHGTYISVDKNGNVSCKAVDAKSNEVFAIIVNNDGTFSFKSCYGTYLSVHKDHSCDWKGKEITQLQKFTILNLKKKKLKLHTDPIAGKNKDIMSCFGKYLSTQQNGSLQWNRDKSEAWEKFKIIKHGNGYAILSFHRKYMTLNPKGVLECTASSIGPNEIFKIEPFGEGFTIKTNQGKYISAFTYEEITADAEIAAQSETVYIQ
ncbi:carbohydrate binding module [Histomonas meleagridis]|uniref:carbohydrate binding module n=1 Tax=Histomonas meleagridis TaxID=135588 RepID=UPI003559B9D0|nr:carbohydrate binding module [Histomonas meleagridis]KAH0806550.1 carbohydrate binding module [Histomonas meleagridis]